MKPSLIVPCVVVAAFSTQVEARTSVTVPIATVSKMVSPKSGKLRTKAADIADGTPSLGQGYDIFSGRLLAKDCAAQQNLIDDVLPPGQGSIEGGFFGELKSLSDVQKSSGISGSASLTYAGFTIGASGGLQNGTTYNGFNRYARVLLPVVREKKRINPRVLGVNGAAAIGDVSRFYESCGRMYVSAIHYGSKLDGTISIITKTQTSTSKNQEGVSVGVANLFSVGVDHQAASAKINQHGSMTMDYTDTGGSGAIPDETTLVDYGRSYREKFPESRVIISIELSPYREIVMDVRTKRLDRVLEDKLQALETLADKRNVSRLRLNQLLFAQANPTLVSGAPTTADDVNKAIAAQQAYLQQIADAVSGCQVDAALNICKTRIVAIGDAPASTVAIVPDA